MKKTTNYELIKKLNLKASPLSEKIQDTKTKLTYVRKKQDLSDLPKEKQKLWHSKLESFSKIQTSALLPFIQCELEKDILVTIRDFQNENLFEFLANKFEKLDSKSQKRFIKNLFFTLIETTCILTEEIKKESTNYLESSLILNIKIENILVDSKKRIYLVDFLKIDKKKNAKPPNIVFKIGLITLYVLTNGCDTVELMAQVTLAKNREKLPKSIYPLLFLCLSSDPNFQIPLSDIHGMVMKQKKSMELKNKDKEKVADNNELSLMRRTVVDQGKDINILEDRLNERGEMIKEAGDYFLSIEKGLFKQTIEQGWLVVKNRMLESQLKEAVKSHEIKQAEDLKKIKAVSNNLKSTQENSMKMILGLGSKDFEQENEYFYKAFCLNGYHIGSVNSLQFFEDPINFQPKLLSVASDQSLIQWDALTLTRDFQMPNVHKAPINKVFKNKETNLVYTGSDDATVSIWDLEEKKCINSIYGSKGPIHDIKPLINSKQLIFSGGDPRIFVYNEKKGKMNAVIKGHQGSVWSFKTVYEDTALVSVSSDRTAKIWDIETRTCLQTFEEHDQDVLTVETLLDEKLLITAGLDQTIRFWDLVSGECVNLIFEGLKTIRTVLPIRNQGTFASFSQNTVSFYDVRNLKKIGNLTEKNVGGTCFYERMGILGYGVGSDIMICGEY